MSGTHYLQCLRNIQIAISKKAEYMLPELKKAKAEDTDLALAGLAQVREHQPAD